MKSLLAKLCEKKDKTDKAKDPMKPKTGPASLGLIIESQKFNVVVFGAIFVNAIQMGVQQDWHGPDYTMFYMILDCIFCVIFAVEMILKLAFLRCHYFRDYWNLLDFSTTWVGIIDLCILTPMYGASGLKVLTAVRILRVFRVLRIARVLRRFKELWLILHGIHQSVKTITWISLLLGSFVYISAILCATIIGKTDIYPGYDEGPVDEWPAVKEFNVYQRFGTMLRSMFTLFQMAILSDDWDIVCRALLEVQPIFLIFVYLFFSFCSFGLLNVIAGVVCDGVVSNSLALQEETNSEEIKKVSRAIDEFKDSVFTEQVQFLEQQDIRDHWGVGEFAGFVAQLHLPEQTGPDEFFSLMDSDGTGQISSEEFRKAMVRLSAEMKQKEVTKLLLETKAVQLRILREFHPADGSGPDTDLGNQLKDLQTDLSLLRSELAALKNINEENQPSASPHRSSPPTVSEATNKSPVGEPEPLAEPQPEPPFAATLGLCPEPDNRFPRGLNDGPVSPQMATWIQTEVSAFLDTHLHLAVRQIAQECAFRIKALQRGNGAQSMSTPRFLAKIDAARDEG